jgi:hypothetical protein
MKMPMKKKGRKRIPWTAAQIKKCRAMLRRHTFEIEVQYSGFDAQLDRQLEKLARRRSVGSGMSFACGLRDIEFSFRSRRHAFDAAARIKSAEIRGVRVFLRSFEEVR